VTGEACCVVELLTTAAPLALLEAPDVVPVEVLVAAVVEAFAAAQLESLAAALVTAVTAGVEASADAGPGCMSAPARTLAAVSAGASADGLLTLTLAAPSGSVACADAVPRKPAAATHSAIELMVFMTNPSPGGVRSRTPPAGALQARRRP